MLTIQNAENALKTVYIGAITELLNTKANPLLAKIEHTGSDVWGKEIRKAVSIGINGGIGAGDESGELPKANSKSYLQFVLTLKNLYGQIEISDKAVRASMDGKGAFTDLLNAELEGLLEASRFNLGRMIYGDGTGKLCSISAKIGDSYPVDNVKPLIEGMIVDAHNASNVSVFTSLKIVAVDRKAKTVRFETNPMGAVTDGSYLVVQGSYNKELTGLEAVFGSGSIYGVNRTNYPSLTPYTKSGVGAIDDMIIEEAIDSLEQNANSTIDFIACANDVKYAYQEYLSQYKRNIDYMELEGGFKSLSYNGIPLVYDRFVTDGTMYLLNTASMKIHQLCDWRFLESENGKVLHKTQGRPTYSATLVKYCDLVCDRPNGLGKLSGITR